MCDRTLDRTEALLHPSSGSIVLHLSREIIEPKRVTILLPQVYFSYCADVSTAAINVRYVVSAKWRWRDLC